MEEDLDAVKKMDEKYHLNCYGPRFFGDFLPVKAFGSVITDADGKEYIDCVGGLASVSVGHNHSRILKVLMDYMRKHGTDHVTNLNYIGPQAEYAKRLGKLLPLHMRNALDNPVLFFCNSGAEATNGALKIAAKNPGHYLVYMTNTFHGRYGTALAATGQEKYKLGFEKTIPRNTKVIEFNNKGDLDKITRDCYAVIFELIQGEGGIIPADPDYVMELRERTADLGVLLITDEVQTGFGRTGKMFASEHYGLRSDIICMAKGIANGYPFGAIGFSGRVNEMVNPGEHASTFGGNAWGSVIAMSVLDIIQSGDLLKKAQKHEAEFFEYGFESLPHVKDVRGKGLLLGVEMDTPENRLSVIKSSKEDGVLFAPSGSSVVRLVPPLNIPKQKFNRALSVLYKNIKKLS